MTFTGQQRTTYQCVVMTVMNYALGGMETLLTEKESETSYLMITTTSLLESKMKVSELIEALSYYDGDDNVTFHFLRNNTEINCQFEDLSFYTDTMNVEFTIQDAYDGIEKVMF